MCGMSLFVRGLSIGNYRSVRRLSLPVERLSVFLGANGVGKTNLYRALQLLQGAAAGTLGTDLAAEGGLASAFWAGPMRAAEERRIRLAADLGPLPADAPGPSAYSYAVEVGYPQRVAAAAFETEPQI